MHIYISCLSLNQLLRIWVLYFYKERLDFFFSISLDFDLVYCLFPSPPQEEYSGLPWSPPSLGYETCN